MIRITVPLLTLLAACAADTNFPDVPRRSPDQTRFTASSDGMVMMDRATGTVVRLAHLSPVQHNDHVGRGRLALQTIAQMGRVTVDCRDSLATVCGTYSKVDGSWIGGPFGGESEPVIDSWADDGGAGVETETVLYAQGHDGRRETARVRIVHELLPSGYQQTVLTTWLRDAFVSGSLSGAVRVVTIGAGFPERLVVEAPDGSQATATNLPEDCSESIPSLGASGSAMSLVGSGAGVVIRDPDPGVWLATRSADCSVTVARRGMSSGERLADSIELETTQIEFY